MLTKLSVLIFIFGIFTVTQVSTLNEEAENSLGNATEVITLDKAVKISIDKILTDASNDVTRLKGFIDSTATRVEKAAAGIVSGAYAAFAKEAALRLQHAGPVGSHVSLCINRLKSIVTANTNARAKAIGGCVTSQVDSTLHDVQTLLGVAQSAERDITAARKALKACHKKHNVFKKVGCIAKATAHVIGQAISLTAKVTRAVVNAVKIYHTFPEAVTNCEKNQFSAAQHDAMVELALLVKC